MKKVLSFLFSAVFLFSSVGILLAADCNFIASKDSNKYHTTDCGIAKNIKPGNKICFKTQEEAIKAGYMPCSVCKPDEKLKVVASKDSDKYHLTSCPLVKNIKKENLVEYNSPAEAVKAGKKPCGICKPPKPNKA